MLVLTRKIDEAIMIGDDIIVKILDIQGGQVRIGVEAPDEVSVHREEVYERIQDEKKAAAEKPKSKTKAKSKSTGGNL